METVRELASTCRIAGTYDSVLNAECCYTFHTPFTSENGIVVNLATFIGTCQDLALIHENEKDIFVRIVKYRESKQHIDQKTPTRLAVGVEGGFADSQYDTIANYSIVVLQRIDGSPITVVAEYPFNTPEQKHELPEMVVQSADSIIQHAGVTLQQDVQAWQLDQEQVPVSKYAQDLPFLDNGVIINPDPKTWKCEKSGDTENLWLNLSDGFIGGGRRHWDGSGGSNGALDHFEETDKKYPLVVKLGTITADPDTADCYSYAPEEDGPVKVPNLAELLEKRGIKITSMQKTVKSTAELEVELNANYAFDAITEAGAHLTPVSGPGLQGLQNLGNSCYMNSVLQLLLSGTVPELARRYGTSPSGSILHHPFFAVTPKQAIDDILCQTAKIGCALTSGVFANPSIANGDDLDPKYRLAPRMLKHVIGKDHVDFRTNQQQDAAQFLQYYLEKLDRAELGAAPKFESMKNSGDLHTSSHLFSFKTTSRMVCTTDGKVKYTDSAPETIWSLRLPMEKATMKDVIGSPEHKRLKSIEDGQGDDAKPIPSLSFATCVEDWASENQVDGVKWSHLGNSTHVTKTTVRFMNFPRYLLIQAQRYTLGSDWSPVKLEVNLDISEEINLDAFKATGPQAVEDLAPENDDSSKSATRTQPAIDEIALSQLMDMGFSLNSSKRALVAVGGSNVEAAMSWVFEHNNDPDFNDPLPEDGLLNDTGASTVDEDVVQSLVESLGCFTADQIRVALKETNGAADRAADWLFSHMDDLDNIIAGLKNKQTTPCGDNSPSVQMEDGPGEYTLIGMVSHIGKNTGSGHYVAHLKKKGKWVIFNDEKVAESAMPPFEHAYLYLFQRRDTMDSPHAAY